MWPPLSCCRSGSSRYKYNVCVYSCDGCGVEHYSGIVTLAVRVLRLSRHYGCYTQSGHTHMAVSHRFCHVQAIIRAC